MNDSKVSILPSDGMMLKKIDPNIWSLIKEEEERQFYSIELIASENFTSPAVMEALGSHLTNKYAEGVPGHRYYGGTEFVDQIEDLARTRALQAFHLDDGWGVNVQPYSGSPANLAAYAAVLEPNSRIMGLSLPSGGHLTHGFFTCDAKTKQFKPVSHTSAFFNSLPYVVSSETGLVDYDLLEERALSFVPALIIAGGSAYPREWDYERMRSIADKVGAILLCDMAHVSGLVASGCARSPFEWCDIVTTTTHKTLRGPRAGMIFFKKEYESKVDASVFPGLQGGPHMNTIAAIAVQLKEVVSPEFHAYSSQVCLNAKTLSESLIKRGQTIVTGGTDNHLLLWDLRPHGITGSKMQKVCDAVSISLNMNTIFGDKSALAPGGVRLGTPAMTTRGLQEADFEVVASYLVEAVDIAKTLQDASGSKKLQHFVDIVKSDPLEIQELRNKVREFASKFPLPGFSAPE